MTTLCQLRYKIAFLATDLEGPSTVEEKTIEIICFGAVADEMIGLPADNLVSLTSNVQGYIPKQIKRLYGAKCDFKLNVPRGAVRRGRTSFRVDSFTRTVEAEQQPIPKVPACKYLPASSQLYIFLRPSSLKYRLNFIFCHGICKHKHYKRNQITC